MDLKRRPVRNILLVLLLVLALAGGVSLSLYLRLDASINIHRAEIDSILEGISVRQATRLALAAPEEAGNVWELLGPAFESLWALDAGGSDALLNFTAHGTPGPTPRLLEEGRSALEACRQSLRRSRLDWTGPRDPLLPDKAARAGRALCSKGYVCWQEGRDAEAMEWFLTSLSVGYDTARLGQKDAWGVLTSVEYWVCEDARPLLAEHRLTAAELEEFERRLDRLRSQRPPPATAYCLSGAERRQQVLQEYDGQMDLRTGDPGLTLAASAGWRDLFIGKVYVARVLTGIRSGMEELGDIPWTVGTDAVKVGESLRSRYREDVAKWLALEPELSSLGLLRLEVFRAALACARFEAAHGRMPLTVDETGYHPDSGSYPFGIDGFVLRSPLSSGEPDWPIGRR